jgi:DNA-binding LacI/PurR family transcriptional regulator
MLLKGCNSLNIREIAKEASVSVATVSRVLNGKSDVSTETRERILTIIKERDFKPKVAVSSISDNIGIFLCSNTTDISNPYSSLVISGISSVIFNHDLNLTLIPSIKISRDGLDFFNFCNLRRISGGIFISSSQDDKYIMELAKYVPSVVVGNDFNLECLGSVRSDNYTGAYEAIKYLVVLGHKNILLIMADLHFIDHKDRYEAAAKAIEESGLEQNEHNILNSYLFNNTDLLYKLDFIFKTSHPDAIFVGGDQEAIRVIKVLNDMGLNVPEDVSVMGYDNLAIAVNSCPPLTTVNQPIYEIGKEAAKLLLNMINDKNYTETKIMLKNNALMIRGSVKERIK